MSDFDIPSAAALRDGLRTMIDERDAELARLRAALAEVTAERDALIERWPESDLTSKTAIGLLVRIDGNWYFDSNGDELSGPYPTREAAVLAAAGLDAKESPPESRPMPHAYAVGLDTPLGFYPYGLGLDATGAWENVVAVWDSWFDAGIPFVVQDRYPRGKPYHARRLWLKRHKDFILRRGRFVPDAAPIPSLGD
jgi:hypothetical protein